MTDAVQSLQLIEREGVVHRANSTEASVDPSDEFIDILLRLQYVLPRGNSPLLDFDDDGESAQSASLPSNSIPLGMVGKATTRVREHSHK